MSNTGQTEIQKNLFPHLEDELGEKFRRQTANYTSEEEILTEIEKIILHGSRTSAQAAREYYSPGRLPDLTHKYFSERGLLRRSEQAKFLSIGTGPLTKVVSGEDLSENMLFRFRNSMMRVALRKNFSAREVDQIIEYPWRLAEGSSIQEKVAAITCELLDLANRINQSNSLQSKGGVADSLEKKVLVAILREIVAKLESPAININEAETATGRIEAAINKGFASAVEESTKAAANQVFSAIRSLLRELISKVGSTSFNGIF